MAARWTKEETALLIKLMANDTPQSEISKYINRTGLACWSRYHYLGYRATNRNLTRLTQDQRFTWARGARSRAKLYGITQRMIADTCGLPQSYVCEVLSINVAKSFTTEIVDRIDRAITDLSPSTSLEQQAKAAA